jgi:hypothetical protein
VAFRWHTLLPLDDCLYTLQATTGSSLAPRFIVVWSAMGSGRETKLGCNSGQIFCRLLKPKSGYEFQRCPS